MVPFKTGWQGMLRLGWAAAVAAVICLSGVAEATDDSRLPASVRAVLAKAGRLMDKKAYQQTVELLSAFQAKGGPAPAPGRPDSRRYHHPAVYFVLGNAYLMLEDLIRAETAYRRALDGDPDFADAWMNLAAACYRQQKYAEAGRCFYKSYETAADKIPERLFYSAAAYLNAGQAQRSIAVFEKLLAAHAEQVEPAWKETLVHALLTADQPRRALPHIKQLVQICEGEYKIRWQEILLQQYLALDMPGEALELARTLTREYPLAARWWKALAHVHLTASRYEDALAAMTIYSWLTEATEEEQRLLADLHLQVGIPVKAAPMYAALLQRRPGARLLQNLVAAYRRLGQPEAALQQLEIFEGQVSNAGLLMIRGDLLYELERYEDAADVYRQAAHSDERQAGRAWLMAGYAAWQKNDLNASRSAFQRAADFNDQKRAAMLAMRRLDRLRQ
jgi:tetratricopeptide (TPR) repeat protein